MHSLIVTIHLAQTTQERVSSIQIAFCARLSSSNETLGCGNLLLGGDTLAAQAIDTSLRLSHTKKVRYPKMPSGHSTLADMRTGQRCILDRLDLPEDLARRLMELGFLPGNEVTLGLRAPGGGPRVYRVDGTEVALRHETARHLYVRRDPESDLVVLK